MRSRLLILLALLCLPALAAPGSPDIVISQIYGGGGNSGATIRNDFVELFNRGSAAVDVTGWAVQYASATGSSWQVTPLNGPIAPGGYYLVQQAQGAGGAQDLPKPDATGAIAMSASSGKVALTREGAAPTAANTVDFVGYGDANSSEGSPTPLLSNTTAALRKSGGCIDTGNNAADFSTAAPTPRNSASPAHICGAEQPPVRAAIHDIQGSGSASELVGATVITTGIVTARKSNGFFLQAPDNEADNDPATSEGIFVFTSSAPPAAAAVGNRVEVTGTVAEYRPASDLASPPLTELTDAGVTALSANNPLPAPVTITSELLGPGGGPEQLERFEGMRVQAPQLTVVGPGPSGVFFGVLPGTPRPFRESGIQVPDPLPPGAPPYTPRWDGNPERLRVSGAPFPVCSGSTVSSLTGPLDYAYRTYTIQLETDQPPAVSGACAAVPVPAPAAGELTIATLNLLQFVAPVSSGRLNKAFLAIRDVLRLPDILGVQEVDTLATLEALAAKLGAGYKAYLEPGNDPSGINVGFLVKTSRVTAQNVLQYGKDAGYIDPNGQSQLLNDRPPLVLRATAQGVPLTVIVNHLRSLIDSDDLRVQYKRRAQAEYLAGLIQAIAEFDPRTNILSIGDYNAFPFNDGYVDVIGAILGKPAPPNQVVLPRPRIQGRPALTNLLNLLPFAQRYSYVQDGSAQVLDHILANSNLLPRVTRLAYARMNADFSQEFRNDPARPERLSDHDAAVAYITLGTPPPLFPAGVTHAATFEPGPVSPGQIVTFFGPPAATRVLFDDAPAAILYKSAGQTSAVVPFTVASRSTTEVEIEYQGARTNRLTLPVVSAVPGIFTLNSSGEGQGAILNQDSSVNGPASPAARGSVVSIYVTGAGAPAWVSIGGLPAEVLRAGAFQIDARVPLNVVPGETVPVVLNAGGAASPSAVTLSVR